MKKTIKIAVPKEKEAMAVAVIVQKANKYESKIYIQYNGAKVNAKSIVGMMSLDVSNGSEIMVSTEGTDEVQAMMELERFLTGV